MVETLWDAITRRATDFIEGGQERRQWLDDLGRRAEYYVPPELRNILGFVAEATPTAAIDRAAQAGGEMLAPGRTPMQRLGSAGQMLSETAGVVAPAMVANRAAMPAAQAIQESLLGASVAADDVGRRFVERLNQPGPVPTMYSNPVGRAADDAPKGILAYHGSPHDFDRFSMSKIGTGEGAQAYGHGLYFAENEGVARGYRDQLSRGYLRTADGANVAEEYGADVADIFERTGGDPQDLKDTVARLRGLVDQNLAEFGVSSVSELKPMFEGDLASTVIEFSDRADRLERLIGSGDVEFFDPGRMYEVRINADPDNFLDWDAPLSEQPQVVQDFANSRWQQILGREPDPTIEGEYIAKMASPQHGVDGRDWLDTGPAADQAKRLREAGIPGIKYLDAGSRDAGEGSRNYVVFDENLIEIVRKYGIAGAALMLGMSQADLVQAMQAQQPTGLLSQQEQEVQ